MKCPALVSIGQFLIFLSVCSFGETFLVQATIEIISKKLWSFKICSEYLDIHWLQSRYDWKWKYKDFTFGPGRVPFFPFSLFSNCLAIFDGSFERTWIFLLLKPSSSSAALLSLFSSFRNFSWKWSFETWMSGTKVYSTIAFRRIQSYKGHKDDSQGLDKTHKGWFVSTALLSVFPVLLSINLILVLLPMPVLRNCLSSTLGKYFESKP